MDRENQWIIEVLNDKLIQMILSNTRDAAKASKVKIRPVLLKEGLMFQETLYLGQKVFHENFSAEEMSERIEKYLQASVCDCGPGDYGSCKQKRKAYLKDQGTTGRRRPAVTCTGSFGT